MARSSKRLDFLVKMTSSGGSGGGPGDDPFVWYGLAMEYRSLDRNEEALSTFEELRRRAPDYVPMYLQCGQLLGSMGRGDDARSWLSAGLLAARSKGDAHAASELESALASLP